jgi:hypothetical protein
MHTQRASSHLAEGLSRRALAQRGLAAGLMRSALRLSRPVTLWGVGAGQPKPGEGSPWVSCHSRVAWEGETCYP